MRGPTYSEVMKALLCHECDHFRVMRLKDAIYAGKNQDHILVCVNPVMTHDAGISYIGSTGEAPCWCPYIFKC